MIVGACCRHPNFNFVNCPMCAIEKTQSNAYFAEMPKSDKTKRVEAHLLPEVVDALQKLAKDANRSLKNYIETLLIEHVKEQKKKA